MTVTEMFAINYVDVYYRVIKLNFSWSSWGRLDLLQNRSIWVLQNTCKKTTQL